MQTYKFSLSCDISIKEVADELANFNLSGCVWISSDDNTEQTKDSIIEYWLQSLGNKGSIIILTENLTQPYYLFQKETNTVKPVYHTNLLNLNETNEIELSYFEEYMQDSNALAIIEHGSKLKDSLSEPLLMIHLTKQNDQTIIVVTLTKSGKKTGINIHKLDVDNVRYSTRVVINSSVYDGYKQQNSSVQLILDLEDCGSNLQEKEHTNTLLINLVDSIFPYSKFEDIFWHPQNYQIKFVKNGRVLLVLLYCDFVIQLPEWDYPIYALPNDSKALQQALEEIRDFSL